MTPSTPRQVMTDFANDPRPTAQVMPFVRTEARRIRRDATGSGEPHGRILLFTGVRYERMTESPAASEPAMPQRRRS